MNLTKIAKYDFKTRGNIFSLWWDWLVMFSTSVDWLSDLKNWTSIYQVNVSIILKTMFEPSVFSLDYIDLNQCRVLDIFSGQTILVA